MSKFKPTAVVIIAPKDDYFAFFAAIKSKKHNGAIGLIGGKIEKNETPKKAAARELYEESGLIINPEDLIFLGMRTDGNHVNVLFLALPDAVFGTLRSSDEGIAIWATESQLCDEFSQYPQWNCWAFEKLGEFFQNLVK